ncbi:MAG: glycosyltransferase, partial [Candidatus Omnitrophica bacterium]|nr:glycosyltransferase [Candidatus Omnitrophota bacterium]
MRMLVVFAREPRPGKVKTRLLPLFSADECARLYRAFVRDTLRICRRADCERRVIAYEAGGGSPGFLRRAACKLIFVRQRGGDLGRRMHNAFVWSRAQGADETVIIGSDTPDLCAGLVDRAFLTLETHDGVIGP